eukprot:3467635-Karenia_brevis.AAC.1
MPWCWASQNMRELDLDVRGFSVMLGREVHRLRHARPIWWSIFNANDIPYMDAAPPRPPSVTDRGRGHCRPPLP